MVAVLDSLYGLDYQAKEVLQIDENQGWELFEDLTEKSTSMNPLHRSLGTQTQPLPKVASIQ